MPIRPENKARYPKDWKAISKRIRHERAGNRCECTTETGEEFPGGRCNAPNGVEILRAKEGPAYLLPDEIRDLFEEHAYDEDILDQWKTKRTKIVLTVAHLDHQPENCDDDNLRAFCQRCHLRYDREHHAETRRRTRDAASGQSQLFADAVPSTDDAEG